MSDDTMDLGKGVTDDAAVTAETDGTTTPIDPALVESGEETVDPIAELRALIEETRGEAAEKFNAVLKAVDLADTLRQQRDDERGLRRMAEVREDDANRRVRRNGWIAAIFAVLFVGATLTGAHFYDAEKAKNGNQPVEVIIDRDGLWVDGEFKGYVDDPYEGNAEPTPRELPLYCGNIEEFVLQFPLSDRLAITESCQP